MAIYLNFAKARSRFSEVGVDLRFVQGPPLSAASTPWTHVLLYFLALQVDWVDNAGTVVGGGHFGLQVYDNVDLGSANRTVVNWGVYDDTIATPNSVCRSSIPIDFQHFIDVNNEVSFGFDFQYGEWIRFRVFKSPKQNWLANEIKPGANQVPPYVDTDQQADEEAWRCTIQRIDRDEYPIAFHDALIKGPATTAPLQNGQCWVEPIGWDVSNLETLWNYSPQCDVRMHDIDGSGGNVITTFQAHYAPTTTNADITFHDTAGAVPGFVRMEGRESGMTRTTAEGTVLAPPVGYFDARPANVTPAITDVAARVATPRPWF